MVGVAIVCEGKNDRDFLEEIINHHLGSDTKNINFYIFRGKSDLLQATHKRYENLQNLINAGQIKKVLFVVDADNRKNDNIFGGYENTKISLNNTIEQLGLISISQTYIMCDPETKVGYLESLILSTIEQEQRNCIQCFLNCSQFESKENHKAILNQIYKLAYPNAPYDFSHSYFNDLKTQLTQLFAESE